MKTSVWHQMRSTGSGLACITLLLTAGLSACASGGPATPATLPNAQVVVTKPATALPGQRYDWVDMPASRPAEADPRVENPELRARLQAAIDHALQEKGYLPADASAPADFLVAYRVGVRDLQQADMLQSRDGIGTPTPQAAVQCGRGGCSQIVSRNEDGNPVISIRTTEYVEGGLLVEIIEPRSIDLLWSSFNRGSVQEGAGAQASLNIIAGKTLEQLPAYGR